MWIYILKRLLWSIPVLLGIAFIIHTVLAITPGDPVRIMLGETATQQQIQAARKELGLDKPFLERYFQYVGKLLKGDLGQSYRNRRPVIDELADVLPATLKLTLAATVLTILLGVPAGIASAVWRGTPVDLLFTALALVGLSMPVFWIGLLLIYYLGFRVPIFPIAGMQDGLMSYVLPSITLALNSMAMISQLTRSTVTEILSEDYIRTARAKGLAKRLVVWKHALRAASIPILTVIGLQFGLLMGGAVLTETVFSWPGIGRLMVSAIKTRDLLLVQGSVLVLALTFVLINTLIDLSYSALDPRVRYS